MLSEFKDSLDVGEVRVDMVDQNGKRRCGVIVRGVGFACYREAGHDGRHGRDHEDSWRLDTAAREYAQWLEDERSGANGRRWQEQDTGVFVGAGI